ncbi:Detected protein of unknown function [Hibiscus syriacus]|uniref:Uncharacterized protein n=1 Tax=Hibiscus syriacus TaxID=106335 RepID=A0A6A3A8R4_HIBSY|nr:Detected protein of unknown function [Hibiscus syriacus]
MVKRRSAILNALLHCHKLKLKLGKIHGEYQNLMAIRNQYFTLLKHMQIPKEVKVEKVARGRVGSETKVPCTHLFAMEATAVAQNQQTTDIRGTQAILKAIKKQGGDRL